MNNRTRSRPNRQILKEASAWFVDFRIGDIDALARQEFHGWLQRSPEHVQAYLEIAGTYAELPLLSTDGNFDVQALIERARSSPEHNLILLEAPASGVSASSPPRARRRIAFTLAASMLLMASAVSTWFFTLRGTYSTQVGEQRSLTLADGSTVELNSLSSIRVRYTDHERHIDLIEGQALFLVAKHEARPFIVRTGDTQVRAVGTRFDVYRKRSGIVVTVVEGRVSITGASSAVGAFSANAEDPQASNTLAPSSSSPATRGGDSPRAPKSPEPDAAISAEVFLTAGEQAIVTHTSIARPARANVAAATAWTARQLIFEATPLAEVAEEFNRYSTRRLIIDARHLGDFNVSGTYSSTNPDSLLRFLRAQPGITLIESDREILVTGE